MSQPDGTARVLDVSRHEPRPHGCADHGQGRAPLSCDRIVDAAIRFVDRECLGDLSMRRLGGELGVEAMSLYRYFSSKAVLLDAVVHRALEELELPSADAGVTWERSVRAYALSFRDISRRHPHLVPLMAALGPDHEALSRVMEPMVAMWRGAGLDAQTAARAQGALQGYLIGSSFPGASCAFEPCAADGPERASGGVPDADFEFGLSVLISGLRGQVAHGAPKHEGGSPLA